MPCNCTVCTVQSCAGAMTIRPAWIQSWPWMYLLLCPGVTHRAPCSGADPDMEAMWYPCEDLGVIKVEKGMLDDHMPNEVVKAFQHVYQQLVEPVKDSTANQPTYNELVTSENSSEEVNITMLY